MNLKKSPEQMRLPGYFGFLQFSGVGSLVLVSAFVYFFPSYFSFVGNPQVFFRLMICVLIFHTIMNILQALTGKKIMFSFVRYGWMVFFCILVYISGGIMSPLMFMLIIPLLVSTVDLKAKDTMWAGIVVMSYLVLLFVIDPIPKDHLVISKHLFTIFIFSIISYYVYNLVKETLAERYEKEEARREASKLVELDQVKSDFITVVSHRLRTPLTGAVWAMTALSEEKTTNSKELVEGGLRNTKDAIAILNELIKTVELNTANLELRKIDCNLKNILENVLHEKRELIRDKKTIIESANFHPIKISADPNLLTVALSGVIDNAIRYSKGGAVSIMAEEKQGKAEVVVKDTGVGISTEDLPYVFERLYRGQNAMRIDPNKNGVGLYLSKLIIGLHNGTISLQSEKDKGTVVTITLPLS